MKRRISLRRSTIPAGLLLFSLMVLASCENHPEGYYESPTGFSVVIPEGWNYQEDPSTSTLVLWEGERDSTAPTMAFVTVDLPEGADNRDFADLNFREAKESDGYIPAKVDTLVVDGDSVSALFYGYRIAPQTWRQGMLLSIVDDDQHGYVVNCSSFPGRIAGDADRYRAILATFHREH